MSATNRGRARIPSDYYPTPAWCVYRLLDMFAGELGLLEASPRVLEPSVGDGAIVRAVETWRRAHPSSIAIEAAGLSCPSAPGLAIEPRVRWTTVELRTDTLVGIEHHALTHHEGVDFRTWVPTSQHDLVLGNPPFEHAEAFVRHALELAPRVCMLLRLGFLGSDERAPWLRENMPTLRVLPDRPSFDGEGTDSDYYAWFCWFDASIPHHIGNAILGSTPVTVRALQKPITPTNLPQTELDFGRERLREPDPISRKPR